MRRENASIAVTVAAVVIALVLCGCAGGKAPSSQGGVELHAYALSGADIATVTVTVTGPGIDAPIVVNLTQVGTQWVANLSEIPAGVDRTFTLSARNADGVEVYHGVATGVTITAGQTASVSISGQETNPPAPVGNKSPVIDALVAATLTVAQGESVALSVAAHDDDVGDLVSYLWTANGGTLDTPAQMQVSWSAPTVDGIYRVVVEVHDPHGAKDSMYVDLTVGAGGSSDATISVRLNKWPVVTAVSASAGRIDVGESATLDVVATDPDNDPLSYAWTVDSTCTGAFDDATLKRPTFTLAAPLPALGTCRFTVTVSDGRGGTNTGALTVSAAPAPVVNLAPRITSATLSLDRVGPAQTVMMSVSANDPEGSDVTFAWTATGGTLGQPSTTAGASAIAWRSPSPFLSEVYVKCAVADASGVTTVKMFTVFVATNGTATGTATGTNTNVDVTPPTVIALAFTQTTADTSAGSATVAVAFRAADDKSGVARVSVQLTSPSGSQSRSCSVTLPTDATPPLTFGGSCDLQLPQNSEAGTWTVKSMAISDAAGNVANLGASDLADYAATLTVVASAADTAAPVLAAFSFTPTSVDTTSAKAQVTVTATLTDNLAGFASAAFMFTDPGETQWPYCWITRPEGASGLRAFSGSCVVELPQYSIAGTWKVAQVILTDDAGNEIRLATAEVAALGFPVNLTVASDVDVTPPVLQAFSLTPSSIDTSAGSIAVAASFIITDDKSGFWQAGVRVTSPSGHQSQECRIYAPTGASPLSYTDSCTLTIPRYSETGTWAVEWLYVIDGVSNYIMLSASDLAASGLPSGLVVTSGP